MEVEYAPTEAEQKKGEEDANSQATHTPHAPAQGEFALTYPVAPSDETYPRDTTFAPVVPPLALGAIAFAIVGLIIWAGMRMTQAAAARNGYTQAMTREMTDSEPASPVAAAGRPLMSPRVPNAPAPPPFNRALVTGPFLGDQTRKAAKVALQPLHALMALIRKYDANGLWTNAGGGSSPGGGAVVPPPMTANVPGLPPGGVAPVTFPGAPTAVGAGAGMVGQTRGATFQGSGAGAPTTVAAAERFSDMVDRIHDRTEALATQIDMTAVPDTYPAPLREDVRAMSQELRSYLKDAEIAPIQDAATRSALRQKATQHLANADQMLTYMEGVVDGTADASHPPLLNH